MQRRMKIKTMMELATRKASSGDIMWDVKVT